MSETPTCPGCGHDSHTGWCETPTTEDGSERCGCLDDRVDVARQWRHKDGAVRVDHMDTRSGDYYGPQLCLCGLPLSKNPHPNAGDPTMDGVQVGYQYECIPCLVKTRNNLRKELCYMQDKVENVKAKVIEVAEALEKKPLKLIKFEPEEEPFVVEDTFQITGRGTVVTGKSDGYISAGDTYELRDQPYKYYDPYGRFIGDGVRGISVKIQGIERWGIMLGKPPTKDEQIGVLLGNFNKDLIGRGTKLYRS